MARETKAQRMERLAAEVFAQQEEAKATYPARLMEALQRAENADFDLKVVNMQFVVLARNETFTMSYGWSPESEDGLEGLNWAVTRVLEARAEAERKYQVKQAALAKLSKEERELLGL
jgi:poly-gamma-glutamate capsule biosynthesis protein CapA/YwtB (metallophosphatase superfamily)